MIFGNENKKRTIKPEKHKNNKKRPKGFLKPPETETGWKVMSWAITKCYFSMHGSFLLITHYAVTPKHEKGISNLDNLPYNLLFDTFCVKLARDARTDNLNFFEHANIFWTLRITFEPSKTFTIFQKCDFFDIMNYI